MGGGGQKKGILKENVYFEVILVKIQQKWGAAAPPVSNTPDM